MALFIHFKFKVMGELLLTFFSDIHTKNSCHTFTPYFLPIESIPCVNFYTEKKSIEASKDTLDWENSVVVVVVSIL